MHFFLTDLLGVLIVLGTLVFVHEFGHYAAAKFFGVRVEVFSLGFGKRLWGFKRGDTDYRLSALPFGGYVRMSGENPMEEHSGDPGEFSSHPRWQRFLIALAGPAMNVILAIVVMTGVYMVEFPREVFLSMPPVIGYVSQNTPAQASGLQAGDQIVRVGAQATPTWESFEDNAMLEAGAPLSLTIQRDGQQLQKQLTANLQPDSDPMQELGVSPKQPIQVTAVMSSSPASAAGIKVGDEIMAVNHQPIPALPALVDRLQQDKGAPVILSVKRAGKMLDLNLTPAAMTIDGKPHYRIGVAADPVELLRLPFPQAFQHSLEFNQKMSALIFHMLSMLAHKQASIKEMSGPVGIAQISGEATRAGILPLLEVMAAISLNLGILNLLPIPILDGGLILLLFIEGILRRDIKQEVKEWVYQAAFVFLVLFAVVVIYNDLHKTLLGRFLP